MKTLSNDMEATVARLKEAMQRCYRMEYGEDHKQELGSGCNADQLSAVARKLGHPLPPSYAAFLEQHNGWTHFTGGARLLAVEDHDEPWVKTRTQQVRDHLREFYDESILDHAFIIMLGQDEPDFVYLDTSTRRQTGEMDVVHFDLIDGEYDRHPDFVAFLKETVADVEDSD